MNEQIDLSKEMGKPIKLKSLCKKELHFNNQHVFINHNFINFFIFFKERDPYRKEYSELDRWIKPGHKVHLFVTKEDHICYIPKFIDACNELNVKVTIHIPRGKRWVYYNLNNYLSEVCEYDNNWQIFYENVYVVTPFLYAKAIHRDNDKFIYVWYNYEEGPTMSIGTRSEYMQSELKCMASNVREFLKSAKSINMEKFYNGSDKNEKRL